MTTVFAEITMTLDGYIAGADISVDVPMGTNGEQIHEWFFPLDVWRSMAGLGRGETGPENDLVVSQVERAGAHIMGRHMFHAGSGDWGDNPWRGHWGENPPYHHPVFVLTHHPREDLVMEGGTTFTFVTDGIERALDLAKAAAGDKDVIVAGGARAIQQYLAAGLVDELVLHISPVLLGAGIRLFDTPELQSLSLTPIETFTSPNATHIRYVTAGEA